MEGQSLAHFLRQAKGRPQTGQTFSGRSLLFTPRTPPFYSHSAAKGVGVSSGSSGAARGSYLLGGGIPLPAAHYCRWS